MRSGHHSAFTVETTLSKMFLRKSAGEALSPRSRGSFRPALSSSCSPDVTPSASVSPSSLLSSSRHYFYFQRSGAYPTTRKLRIQFKPFEINLVKIFWSWNLWSKVEINLKLTTLPNSSRGKPLEKKTRYGSGSAVLSYVKPEKWLWLCLEGLHAS